MSQYYIGIKRVYAYPLIKDDKEGYAIYYNKDTDKQYISWSPKDEFENQYLAMGHDNDGSKISQQMVDRFTQKIEIDTIKEKCTVVAVELQNGMIFVDSLACVDPKNYDEKIGTEICVNNVKNKVWGLLGFVLQWANEGLKSNA